MQELNTGTGSRQANGGAGESAALTRINVGCGSTPTDGWLNFDNSPLCRLSFWPGLLRLLAPHLGDHRKALLDGILCGRIRYANAVSRIPLPDQSVRIVYTSHMLDQLPLNRAPRFLQEVMRVLEPGGYLRIAVVDLRLLAEEYLAGVIEGYRFVERTMLAANARETSLTRLKHFALGPRGYRRWIYDGPMLIGLLQKLGFINAISVSPGETSIPDPGGLRLDERVGETVYVEARKPGSGPGPL